MDGKHATGLFDKVGVLIDSTGAGSLLVQFTDLQDVVQTIKGHLDDLVVHHLEKIAQRLDAPLLYEVSDLGRLEEAAGSGVRNGPACFLLGLEVGILEDVDEGRDDVGLNNGLNLMRGTGGDVGNSPAGLLADWVLGRGKKGEEGRESSRSNDNLSLQIITGDNVSY